PRPATTRARPHPARPEIHSYRLPNGAELHVEPRREVPVVALRGALLGGLLAEDERSAGLTHMTTATWMRGTRRRGAAELARAIESIAGDLDGFSGRSSFGLHLDVLAERLDAGLELFAEVLLEPAFSPDELERERRDTLAALARREDRLGTRVFDLFAAAHWRAAPHPLPRAGPRATVTPFPPPGPMAPPAPPGLARHPRARPGDLALAGAGAAGPARAAGRLSLRLAERPADAFEPRTPPVEAPPEERRVAELRKDRAQAHLVVGFRGLTVHDPDRFALEVIVQLLAGQGGRLFLELRDKKSLAYAVNAMNVEGLAPGR